MELLHVMEDDSRSLNFVGFDVSHDVGDFVQDWSSIALSTYPLVVLTAVIFGVFVLFFISFHTFSFVFSISFSSAST